MTTIVNNSTSNKVKAAINATATKKQAPADGSAPPSRAKSDPSSTASTINKATKPDMGKIEFGGKNYRSGLIKEVRLLRSNPETYAQVLLAHVKLNPTKFNTKDPKFKKSLKEVVTALEKKKKGTLPALNDNPERCAIAGKGMELLTTRGLDLLASRGGDGSVDTSHSDFLSYFIDHDPIEHLRKGGESGDGDTTMGSDNALSALKKKAGGQAMFHATDLENLHVTTHDSLTVRDVIAGWLIDHGVPDKGHRNALLNAGITEIGVGTSTATIVDKNDREVTVKITGMNFYGIYDFSKGKLIKDPPTK